MNAELTPGFRHHSTIQTGSPQARTVVNVAVSALLATALSWVLVGCRDSSPLSPTAPQVALRAAVAAASSSTEFDGFINFCHAGDPSGFRVTPGGTVHFGVSNENRWVTGNPLIDGVEHNTGDANINPDGQVVVRLKNSLKPGAVNGTWEIIQQVRVPDGVSTGVGHGTGDLQGMTIKFTTDPTFVPTSVCNPDMLKAGVHGVILSPAS
jgi:hypothetical protein